MPSSKLNVLVVAGSPRLKSVTRLVTAEIARELAAEGCTVDILDLQAEPLPLYNPDTSYTATGFKALQQRVHNADVVILGTPDYHGSISSTLKNFLDHFWHEFAGKLFVPVVASHEKGLTVVDQLRTVARQCYAWTLPYAVSFSEHDLKDGQVVNDTFKKRLEMMLRDVRVYGELLADQRREDLTGTEPGFLARHRK
jgi:NAD(P)H-dependent FMN reductase